MSMRAMSGKSAEAVVMRRNHAAVRRFSAMPAIQRGPATRDRSVPRPVVRGGAWGAMLTSTPGVLLRAPNFSGPVSNRLTISAACCRRLWRAQMAGKHGTKNAKSEIIVKKYEIVEGGHHGGAWKVGNAVFVTAMMAFSL